MPLIFCCSSDTGWEGKQLIPANMIKKEHSQKKITDTFKVRKKRDRFDGIPESEIEKRSLPDHLAPNLDILIVSKCTFVMYNVHVNNIIRCMFVFNSDVKTTDDGKIA